MNIQPRRRLGRDIHEAHRVSTPLELLFDLTFVVAIALASAQLHHGVVEGHGWQATIGFALAFFAIWWAWMNYTWFASAYDSDDLPFRLLTLVQMFGVLIFATGVPGLFQGDFRAGVTGYVVMRIALAAQWLRAARGDPACRKTCLRYAAGVFAVQLGWCLNLFAIQAGILQGPTLWFVLVLLAMCDMAVPLWAERPKMTPWHAHHIAERYGLMVIITLGECVLGTTNAIANFWQTHGWTFDLILMGFAGTLLIFSMWWMYFLLPSGDALHKHRERAFVWGYGHFVLFASIAATGAALEVVADVVKSAQAVEGVDATVATHAAGSAHSVSPLLAISMVAGTLGLFVIALWSIHRYLVRARASQLWVGAVVLACIAVVPVAVWHGLPITWGLLLLSIGPIFAIAYNENGRRKCATHFEIQ